MERRLTSRMWLNQLPPPNPKPGPKPGIVCFYCKGDGHMKRNFPKYLLDKKAGKVNKRYI
jgi:hypothetical protein